ncbi:MAG: B12-binding domain-containing radical SAM protein [Acidobacteria bacterium]|nr:MAG: B12-binding domain-containing radical SAM protein [Acidobacteriota bacterium]
MKVEIVQVWRNRYEERRLSAMVPPLTSLHLAALVPNDVEVAVRHEKVSPVDYDTDADLVALSFFTGVAARAYAHSRELRRRGKKVVMGGPHVTMLPDEAAAHADAVVVGEGEPVWRRVIEDAARGRLAPRYQGEARPLAGLPPPRYDLLEPRFAVRRVVMATRGCPYRCSFCTTAVLFPRFRTRPVEEVVRDIESLPGGNWLQRKLVWFWDDNLLVDRRYGKALLRAMVPLRKWWVTQTSLDCAEDEELLDLMRASGCAAIFIGIETLDAASLRQANKMFAPRARVARAIERLHEARIAVLGGYIVGFDGERPADVVAAAAALDDLGVDVPFLSVLTPYPGTPQRAAYERAGRLLGDRGWRWYDGYNVAFRPAAMTPAELEAAHRELWRQAFALGRAAARVVRVAQRGGPGALALAAAMNGYYGLRQLLGRIPAAPGEEENEPPVPSRSIEEVKGASEFPPRL